MSGLRMKQQMRNAGALKNSGKIHKKKQKKKHIHNRAFFFLLYENYLEARSLETLCQQAASLN